jgi:hypothetical protein
MGTNWGIRGLSPTVREGSVLASHEIEPSLTVGLVPRRANALTPKL